MTINHLMSKGKNRRTSRHRAASCASSCVRASVCGFGVWTDTLHVRLCVRASPAERNRSTSQHIIVIATIVLHVGIISHQPNQSEDDNNEVWVCF